MSTTGSTRVKAGRGKRQDWAAKGEAAREAALDKLAAGIRNLSSSDEWQRYLQVQARFPRYSFYNTMLILTQCPAASRVMSFGNKEGTTGWKSLGRHVKGPDPETGERQHALYIYAPRHKKVVTHDERTGEDEEHKALAGFVLVPVYDVSQTEGAELPEPVKLLQGEDHGRVYLQLRDIATRRGWDVVEVDDVDSPCPGSNGVCEHKEDGTPGTIYIRRDRSPLQKAKTLAHEMTHAALHSPKQVDYASNRGRCELEAESGAFVVLDTLGIDSGDYSFGYVLGWQRDDPDKAEKQIKASGDAIGKTARGILEDMERAQAEATESDEVDAATPDYAD